MRNYPEDHIYQCEKRARYDARIPVSEDVYRLTPKAERKHLVVRNDNLPVPPTKGKGIKPQARNTHHAVKVWSELCQRTFDSRAEAVRGEELWLLQKAGEISDLQFQVVFILSVKPRVKITIDYAYCLGHNLAARVYEDAKGWRLTKKTKKLVPRVERDFRVKLAWLKSAYGIDVKLV